MPALIRPQRCSSPKVSKRNRGDARGTVKGSGVRPSDGRNRYLNWNRLKELRCWTPLVQVSPSAERLGDGLFRLDPTQYVIAVPYNEQFERTDRAPFVTILLWAETDGAAKRAKLMDIEADEKSHVTPPAELLLPGQSVAYGDIVKELRRGQHGTYQETASYRIAKDGAFVDRNIATPILSFHFRKREDDPTDRCYAIQYRLS